MKLVGNIFFVVLQLLVIFSVAAQPGEILETGDQVLDPNSDGFISIMNTGFSADGYDVDEFEITMFGIPIFGDGESLGDVQSGPDCGVTDLALDTAGYALYAGFDANENLIFRFRLAGDKKSVQSYSILIDTDQLVGTADPNSSAINPGFEIAITLIQKFGVYIYDVDGIESCPTPLRSYDISTHQQKATSALQSCGTTDIYIDFYVPFSDLETLFGITPDSNLRFVGVTNISATCVLDGSVSDIGGVNDDDYNGCFSCAILDLSENQCPSSITNISASGGGFPLGYTATPEIDLPILVGDFNISGTAEAESEIYIELYSEVGSLRDSDTTMTDPGGFWQSNDFIVPLASGDSVVVNAFSPGKCISGLADAGLTFAIVTPNQPPQISGSTQTVGYKEQDPPVILLDDATVSDDNIDLTSASVSITGNFKVGFDILAASPPSGIIASYDGASGILSFNGTASLADYDSALRSVTYLNNNATPSLDIRTVSFIVNDGTNDSQSFNKNILLSLLNELPVINGTGTDLIYTEGSGAVSLDDMIVLTDADNTDMVSASVIFTDVFLPGEDTLVFVDQNGIQGIFSDGVLSMMGVSSIANYQTAIRSITYENKSSEPDTLKRTVTFTVNDGTDNNLPYDRKISFILVNDPPEIIREGGVPGTLTYTEGDGAVLLDELITVTDVDSDSLTSATITILTNFLSIEDTLVFTDQNGIIGSYLAGVLTLTGSSGVASYQTALRSITYENISDNPNTLTRTVNIIISDNLLPSSPIIRDIIIVPINDPPQISGSTLPLVYNEAAGGVSIDDMIVLSDVDNTTLASAIITISTNFHSGEDILAFVDQNGITGIFTDSTLVLTGIASIADYQTGLRSITYENTSVAPFIEARTVEFIINDNADNSLPFNRNIIIIPIIEAPVVTTTSGGASASLTYTEGDGEVTILSGLAATDPDDINLESATLIISSNYIEGEDILVYTDQNGISGNFNSTTGILLLQGSSSLANYLTSIQAISYQNTSENPSDLPRTVLLAVSDGDTTSRDFTITINVIPVNDAPQVDGVASPMVYKESSGSVVIESEMITLDVDNDQLQSATITITDNYVMGEDILVFTDQLGITAVFDDVSGVLTLSGGASVADYQTALRNVTYENPRDRASPDVRIVEFIVNDGDLPSIAFLKEVEIEEVIDPVIVYQVVTPDGDNMNDTWVIEGIEQYPNNTVSLFNRYNSIVYKQESYSNEGGNNWSGQSNEGFNKGELPDGTYFYRIDLGNGTAVLDGFIVLKRK